MAKVVVSKKECEDNIEFCIYFVDGGNKSKHQALKLAKRKRNLQQ